MRLEIGCELFDGCKVDGHEIEHADSYLLLKIAVPKSGKWRSIFRALLLPSALRGVMGCYQNGFVRIEMSAEGRRIYITIIAGIALTLGVVYIYLFFGAT